MSESIYEIPESLTDIQNDYVSSSDKFVQYRIVNYSINEMDNIQSMNYFIELVDGLEGGIFEDEGTMLGVELPNGMYIRIDSGGLGDFYSHEFVVSEWID